MRSKSEVCSEYLMSSFSPLDLMLIEYVPESIPSSHWTLMMCCFIWPISRSSFSILCGKSVGIVTPAGTSGILDEDVGTICKPLMLIIALFFLGMITSSPKRFQFPSAKNHTYSVPSILQVNRLWTSWGSTVEAWSAVSLALDSDQRIDEPGSNGFIPIQKPERRRFWS